MIKYVTLCVIILQLKKNKIKTHCVKVQNSCCLHEEGVAAVCADALLFGDDIDVVVAGAAGTG